MRQFTDVNGKTWTIAINVNTVKRVRAMLGVDLLDVENGKLFQRLYDPVTLCNVLYVVCKTQADADGVTDEQFGEAMAGDAIENATTAFLEELVNFSPNPRDRANLGKVMQATRDVLDKTRTLIEKRLESPAFRESLEQKVDAELKKLSEEFGDGPESSA